MNFIRRYFLLAAFVGLLGVIIFTLKMGQLEPADYTIFNAEAKTIDPAIATGVPEGRILYALYEGLCSQDPQTLKPIPGVAESWKISDDQKNYRFFIRKEARWSDGSPLTSKDFVWSFQRMLHPATGAQYAYELYYLENARKYTKRILEIGDKVEVDIPKTEGTHGLNSDFENLQTSPMDLKNYRLRGVLKNMENDEKKYAAAKSENDEKKKKNKTLEDIPKHAYDYTVYTVEIDGKEHKFDKSEKAGRTFAWLLIDSDTIGIHENSPHELEMQLEHPVPYFLDLMSFYTMFAVNRKCIEDHQDEGRSAWMKPGNLVSNGPFKLEARRIRERVRVVKNEHYWDKDKIKLNRVDFLSGESTVTWLNFYLTGQADWIESVPASTVPTLIAQNRPDYKPAPYIATNFYRFNVERVPLNNKKMRQALNMAIDKDAICKKILQAGQQPARNIVSPVITDHKPAFGAEYNPELARKFKDEALQDLIANNDLPAGTETIKLQLQFNQSEQHQAIAEFIQGQWEKNLGIKVDLNQLEWGAFQANEANVQFQVSRGGWVGDYVDASTFLGMFVSDSLNNCTNWSNKEYDKLIAQAKEVTDPEKRKELFYEAEKILMDESPVIPLFFQVSNSMSRTYVKGVYPNYHDVHPYKGIWIDTVEKERVLREEATR